jgi:hypothetical protein
VSWEGGEVDYFAGRPYHPGSSLIGRYADAVVCRYAKFCG